MLESVGMRAMLSVRGSPIPDQPAFQYWKCSDCPWTCDLPASYPRNPRGREAEALERFEKHSCAEYNAIVRGISPVQPERRIRPASADRADRIKTLEEEARARSLWLEMYDGREDHEKKEDAASELHSSRYARVVREIQRLGRPK